MSTFLEVMFFCDNKSHDDLSQYDSVTVKFFCCKTVVSM